VSDFGRGGGPRRQGRVSLRAVLGVLVLLAAAAGVGIGIGLAINAGRPVTAPAGVLRGAPSPTRSESTTTLPGAATRHPEVPTTSSPTITVASSFTEADTTHAQRVQFVADMRGWFPFVYNFDDDQTVLNVGIRRCQELYANRTVPEIAQDDGVTLAYQDFAAKSLEQELIFASHDLCPRYRDTVDTQIAEERAAYAPTTTTI
jgi:hypothetical protein